MIRGTAWTALLWCGAVGCAVHGPPAARDLAVDDPRESGMGEAIDEAIPVLARHDPPAAATWRRWRAVHDDGAPEIRTDFESPELVGTPIPGSFTATAYAAPVLEARRHRDDAHAEPILSAPSDDVPAEDLPTRREISQDPNLAPAPIGWVGDALDAYLAEVNGSVALRFDDDELACLAWRRTNERPYTSLGRRLVETGLADASTIDLSVIRRCFREDPAAVRDLMLDNDRVVFFEEIDADRWPRASTGARLVARHAAAVDPEVVPLGSVLLVEGPSIGRRIVVAVDTGGAIRGRRIDLYLGAGADALAEAGAVVEEVTVSILEPASPASR